MTTAPSLVARSFTFVKTTPPAAATKTTKTPFSHTRQAGGIVRGEWRADQTTIAISDHFHDESFSLGMFYLDTLKILEQYLVSSTFLFTFIVYMHTNDPEKVFKHKLKILVECL